MDPTTLLASLLSYVLPMLPAKWAADVASLGIVLAGTCAIAARHWPRPKDGSKWLWLYSLVNAIGQNAGHAANADDAAAKASPPKT
ncbi:hypothetical protein [Acetobacter lovaniensis]|uniref:Uncharacterized protein n=1 Tax=Acetobacter lovaniensis TaxID=104100 RepID=A0A841QI66_9PROT|nr:hypothetical protein [Acetobacter lovaniensis]MBB6458015.1 hypothetical protein [Acetobacter lovaniensis]NHN82270.1 hypothetical protein [Acetobacter lovaniensis]GBQ72948.1 hypothetical protein AA0474_2826 [Acetobacter lovaniensis NRIC 0474]